METMYLNWLTVKSQFVLKKCYSTTQSYKKSYTSSNNFQNNAQSYFN